MSPLSPRAEVWETAWHYMQGGPGVFTGDLHFYQVEGDIRGRIGAIDTSVCPLYLLTGEYDYSASPRDTQAVAERVKGASFTVMKGLGHFPMSENPEAFLGYLRPVLEQIRLTPPSPRRP
jgi:pimeloyl-ACP methyl ester carboxylesterase